MKFVRHRSLILPLYLMLLCLTPGCVSVSLKGEPFVKSKTLEIANPKPPFLALRSNQGFDYTFRNTETTSTIAVLSECSSKQRLSLDAVEADFAGILSFRERKIYEKNKFGVTPSQFSVFQGQLDGKNLILALFITNKMDCVYSFSMIAAPENFNKDLPELESLIRNSKW